MSTLKHGGKRHTPLPKGPYTVGCIDLMTGYSNRSSFIRLYYPCVEIGTIEHMDQWPKWAEKEYIEGYTNYFPYPKYISKKIFHLTSGNVYIPAILDAIPLSKGKPFPVIIFSHGLCACRSTYSAIHVDLASHGYIIASVEHRDRSACYSFYVKKSRMSKYGPYPGSDISEVDEGILDTESECDDVENYRNAPLEKRRHGTEMTTKQTVPFHLRSLSRRHAALRNKQLHQRAEECIRALNVLEDLNNGLQVMNVLHSNCQLEKFRGLLDMSKLCMAGHSFGGATVLKTLSMEKKFKVGIAFDAWMIPIEVESESELPSLISQPILFINSNYFYTRRTLEELQTFDSKEVERKFVTIKKTIHSNQCDLPFIAPRSLLIFLGEIFQGNPHTYLKLMNRLMMTFLSKHLGLNINASFNDYIKSKSSFIKENIAI